jgi:RecJ-like exonuclease
LEKVHFEVQYDQPLIIEHEKLKEFFKKSLVEMQSSNKQKFVHQNFICHICQCTPIIGVRYECLECKVNFCEICEEINSHEHDRLVHKGNLKVIDTVNDSKDTFIKKLFEMGFDDVKKVRIVAEKYKYDLNKTVNDLLFN